MKLEKINSLVRKFLVFFLIFSFVVTCNFILFFNLADFDMPEIKGASYITIGNLLFLSILFTIFDEIRRNSMVSKPVRQIRQGMDQIMAGNFHIRIPYIEGEDSHNEFDDIIKGLNEMAVELSSVETLRTDFISNVSHELKTPLTVIQNYGTILQNPNIEKEKQIEYARAITMQTRKLSDLITNILKLNRLENQQIYPDKKKYILSEQICECLLMFEDAWENKNLEIETDLEEDIIVYQDSELLSLVWNNLFSNAIKFSNEGGIIKLSVKRENEYAVVTVSDTGCGISPEIGSHIFEKFYQGDTSHATQGNGLGLALVKRVVDIIGGDIKVQSVLGEGTSFSVYLKEVKDEENV